MASPFSIFRKYSYVFIVVFGVMLMIAFVILPPMDEYLRNQGTGGRSKDDVALTWTHGTVSDGQLDDKRSAHNLLVRFLEVLQQKTQEAQGTPKPTGITPIYSEEELIRTMVLAKRAEQMGVVISDEAVLDYLDDITGKSLRRDSYRQIAYQATDGRFSYQAMLNQLRLELLAQQALRLAGGGLSALPPGLAFDYHKRLHRRVEAELFPVNVADYVNQVSADPTPQQIQQFYSEHKNRFPHPNLPEPGFKRRHQIAFQYLKADLGKFLEEEMAKVTEEQIEQSYQERIAGGDFKVTPPPADTGTRPDGAPLDQPADSQAPVEKPLEEKTLENGDQPPPETSTPPVPAPNEQDAVPQFVPDSTDPPAFVPDAAEPAGNDTDAATEPAPAEPAELPRDGGTAADEADAPGADEPSASLPQRQAFVSVQDESGEAPDLNVDPDPGVPQQDALPPEADVPSTAVDTETPTSDKPPADEPLTDEPLTDEPLTDAPLTDEPLTDAPPADAPLTDAPLTDPLPADAPATEEAVHQPLEQVREQIRSDLARQPAQQRMEAAMKEAQNTIRQYVIQYRRWEAQSKTDSRQPEPGPLDAKELAQRLNMTAAETPLVDEISVAEYELGKSFQFSFAGGQFRMISFPEIAFNEGKPLYVASQISAADDHNVTFIYWKIDEKPAVVPELKEIQDEVIQAWKMIKARELARQDAVKQAEKARNNDQPLQDVLGSGVIHSGEFSWMTRGATSFSGPGNPVLSRVEGVEAAGPDFMEAVFSLKPGQVGVAVNHPQTVMYVVRVVRETPSEESLREIFLAVGITNDIAHIAQMEASRAFTSWYEGLEKEMAIQWKRDPVGTERF